MNIGSDHASLGTVAKVVGEASGWNKLQTSADRGYFNGPEISECGDAGVTPHRTEANDVKRQGRRTSWQGRLHLRGAAGAGGYSGVRKLGGTHACSNHGKMGCVSLASALGREAEGFSRDARDRDSHALEPYEVGRNNSLCQRLSAYAGIANRQATQ